MCTVHVVGGILRWQGRRAWNSPGLGREWSCFSVTMVLVGSERKEMSLVAVVVWLGKWVETKYMYKKKIIKNINSCKKYFGTFSPKLNLCYKYISATLSKCHILVKQCFFERNLGFKFNVDLYDLTMLSQLMGIGYSKPDKTIRSILHKVWNMVQSKLPLSYLLNKCKNIPLL